MIRGITALCLTLVLAAGAPAQQHEVTSPDGRTRVVVDVGGGLTWSVSHAGQVVLEPSPLSLTLGSGQVLGANARVADSATRSVDTVIRPVVAEKNAIVPDRYRELRLTFEGDFGLLVRAYDDGVAYRFTTSFPDSIRIAAEEATFRFAGSFTTVFGADPARWMSHQEPLYEWIPLDDLEPGAKGLTPMVLEAGEDGPRLVVMESALEGYPGMHLVVAGDRTLAGAFPPRALGDDIEDIRNVGVTGRAEHIARTEGTRSFPWRILAIAGNDAALIENQIVYRLAPELRIDDPFWIEPGKVAWDWWNDWNIHGVDFRAGINQATYEHYIDFAAEYGLRYIILDEGWSPIDDLLSMENDVDVPALVEYGRQRDVGIILWAVWKPLDLDMEQVLDRWQEWGVAGMKVDFMQRDDQAMVEFYWRLAREAADRQMLVDYHGAYKPAGLRRAYPNVMTREGVRGLEYSKWSADVTPGHDATLPFTRMLAGPMDYTPGAMVNATRQNFRAVHSRPMSQGTRAHQMALFVLYESPLQMLADNPTHYREEPEVTRFIADVPTTWDETRALMGESGEYVAVARRKGDSWWVGAITDWQPRTLTLDLSFLDDRVYTMAFYQDGENADRYGEDYVRGTWTVRPGEPVEIELAPGGGWVARFDWAG